MFKFKVWLCKAIGDVHSTADESVKLRFYKQTKKKNISEQNNHTNNYLPDRDNFYAMFFWENIHTLRSLLISKCNRTIIFLPLTLFLMWVVAPAKFVLFLHLRNFSFLSIYSARFSESIYKWSNLKFIYELTEKENISHCGTHKHSFFFSCLRGTLLVDQL